MVPETPSIRKVVLLIEDDPEIRRLSELILRSDFDLVTAPEGVSGIHMARKLQPDLVLLDVYMEGMNGFEVCQTLKEDPDTAEIPVAMFTAGAQPQEIREGFAMGADDYITKPFDPDELLVRIKKLIHG